MNDIFAEPKLWNELSGDVTACCQLVLSHELPSTVSSKPFCFVVWIQINFNFCSMPCSAMQYPTSSKKHSHHACILRTVPVCCHVQSAYNIRLYHEIPLKSLSCSFIQYVVYYSFQKKIPHERSNYSHKWRWILLKITALNIIYFLWQTDNYISYVPAVIIWKFSNIYT
jgi:hypothetical protein